MSTYAQSLVFIQGNTKEGIVFTVTNVDTGADIDITSALKIEFRCFKQDFSAMVFNGDKAGGEIDEAYGNSNQCKYSVQAGDMDTPGTYLGELMIEYSDNTESRNQDLIIKIKPKAPIT